MTIDHTEDNFDITYPETIASLLTVEYSVNMMIARYFAPALFKQYDAVLPFVNNQLDEWTHNRTIQKAIESSRIKTEQKKCPKLLGIR